MSLETKIKRALIKATNRAGNMVRLAQETSVANAAINRFISGKRSIGNMTIHTLERLFPEIEITFFQDEAATGAPPGQPTRRDDLGPYERKLLRLARSMNQEGQLEAIEALARLSERYPSGADEKHEQTG